MVQMYWQQTQAVFVVVFWYLAAVGRNDACLIPAIYGVQYGNSPPKRAICSIDYASGKDQEDLNAGTSFFAPTISYLKANRIAEPQLHFSELKTKLIFFIQAAWRRYSERKSMDPCRMEEEAAEGTDGTRNNSPLS
ncbi:hypothetical protein POUND7_011157 [Theobroma cacao]